MSNALSSDQKKCFWPARHSDSGVVDEAPKAYKDIDQVMAAQTDLVEIVAELKQVLCVKG